MRAVNLVPAEARRATPSTAQAPAYLVLGVLALAVVLVTIYVLTTNTISDRQAKLTTLRAQVAQEQAEAARLGDYTQFEKLAQTREQTVQEIASTRFNWYQALSDLSRVVPANTSLQALSGTVVPGAGGTSGSSSSSGGGSNLRGGVPGPAFELQGCTGSQDDVARLMSRLRVINNVTRVTLSQANKPDSSPGGASTGVSTAGSSAVGCGADKPTFDVLVFFQTVPGAGPTGPAAGTIVSTSSGSTGGSSASTGGTPVSTSTSSGGGK